MEILKQYWPLLLVFTWFLYKLYKGRIVKKQLPQWLKDGAVIVDVRSEHEFAMGHAPGSINIPLQDLGSKSNQLPKNKPLLVCCASGTRSGMAVMELKRRGFQNVHNIGAWTVLK